MSTRLLMGTGLLLALAGCSASTQVAGDSVAALGVGGGGKMRCPDPATDCTSSNGPGIYFAEDGSAGIGRSQMLITHFINHGGSAVTFQGVYHDTTEAQWLYLNGTVPSASYLGTPYLVRAVGESGTVPTWVLNDGSPAGLRLSGAQLKDLVVQIHYNDPVDETAIVELSFGELQTATDKATVQTFPLHWSDPKHSLSGDYCFSESATKTTDTVVFQQGIDVNPATAMVTRDETATPAYVTLSCRFGGIATVRTWGYMYRPGGAYDVALFDAGLHMKRASYCGDSSYYTVNGTQIYIQDAENVRSDGSYINPKYNLEAYWTPTGAACVTGTYRHKELVHQWPKCNGQALPSCSSDQIAKIIQQQPTTWLEDGVAPQTK